MSKYFDKSFFKFLLGFVVIITFSMIIIVAARVYEEGSKGETANVLDSEGK